MENLSIKYLIQKHKRVIRNNDAMRRLGRVEQLLNMMKDIGVPAQHIYDLNINIKV